MKKALNCFSFIIFSFFLIVLSFLLLNFFYGNKNIKLSQDNMNITQASTYNLYTVDESRNKTTKYDMEEYIDNPIAIYANFSDEFMTSLFLTSPEEREGYKFIGWKAGESSVLNYYVEYDYWDLANIDNYFNNYSLYGYTAYYWDNNKDLYLYAQWEVTSVKVWFNANGGEIDASSEWTGSGTEVSKFLEPNSTYGTLPTPTRTGYEFLGWYTETTGGTRVYSSTSLVSQNTHTIFARWRANTYNVIFYGKGGSTSEGNISQSQVFTYDKSENLIIVDFLRTGYAFQGWDTSSAGKTVVYTQGQEVLNLTSVGGFSFNLYAVWEALSYVVEFDANDGIGNMASQSFVYDTSQQLRKNAFTRKGYSFLGWNLSSDATTAKYSDEDEVKNLVSEGSIRLYAIWRINNYTLSLDARGGVFPSLNGWSLNGDIASKAIQYNQRYGQLPIPFKKGYVFKGWYDLEMNTFATEDILMADANAAYHAEWQDTWANYIKQPISNNGVYEISCAENLAWIAAQSESRDVLGSFVQTKSIDLSLKVWKAIGNDSYSFKGSYDGQGYAIVGLNIEDIEANKTNYQGLFGHVLGESKTNKAIIKNIRLLNGKVCGYDNVGGLVGMAGNAEIINCSSSIEINANDNVGGFIGKLENNVSFSNCYIHLDLNKKIVGNNNVGGFIGIINGAYNSISCCSVAANLKGTNYVGGLIGRAGNLFNLSASAYQGDIEKTGSSVGAFVGYSQTTSSINDCFAAANIQSNLNHGLFAGNIDLLNCVFEINGDKFCKGDNFTNWSALSDGRPIPSGLVWLAGEDFRFDSDITGYTKI